MSMMSPSKAAGGVILATALIPAGSAQSKVPAGTKYDLNLKWNPDATPQTTIIIPANETWELKDLYLSTALAGPVAAGFNASQVKVKKDADRIMDYSEVLAAVITTNPGRPNGLHANITYEGASQLSAEIQTTAEMTIEANTPVTLIVLIPYEKHA